MLGLCGEGGMRWERFEGDWRSGFDGLQGGVSNFSPSLRLWGVLERGGELMRLAGYMDSSLVVTHNLSRPR